MSPISRIFGGRSRSTLRFPNQSDTVTVEEWRSLQLNIQVLSPSILPLSLGLTFKLFAQPDSVHTIQDSLVHISQPQPLQVGQSGSIEASQQVRIEELPPVLVLHLNRFLYDATTDGLVKVNKPVHFGPELEIPLGTILLCVSRANKG
jgi:ubiquitin carboxyl-terminal hydrolase 10